MPTGGGTDDALNSVQGLVLACENDIPKEEDMGNCAHWQATSSVTNWLGSLPGTRQKHIIMHHPQQVLIFSGVEILWRCPRGHWLGNPVSRTCFFKILLMPPCMSLVIGAISICRRPSRESLTMSCNISPEIRHRIVWTLQNPYQKVVSRDGIRVNLTQSTPSADLPPFWLPMGLLIQCYMKCILRANLYRNPFRQHPDIGAICFESNYSKYNTIAVSLQRNIFQWIDRQCRLEEDRTVISDLGCRKSLGYKRSHPVPVDSEHRLVFTSTLTYCVPVNYSACWNAILGHGCVAVLLSGFAINWNKIRPIYSSENSLTTIANRNPRIDIVRFCHIILINSLNVPGCVMVYVIRLGGHYD